MQRISLFLLAWLVLFTSGAVGQVSGTPEVEAPTPTSASRVVVIPVEQPIDKPQLYLVRRGVQQARDLEADAIVLTMDTPGGRVDVMQEIVSELIGLEIPTYTLVTKHAFSAGAIIAVATDHIYMQPQSVIGDSMPVIMGQGGYQEQGEAEREKMESAVDAIARTIAQAKNRDVELIRCMVRRKLEYKLGDKVISPAGEILTLTNVEAEQLRPDGTTLLSEGTVKDLDAMLQKVGLGQAQRIEVTPTWADKTASLITTISPILLTIAFLCFYIEMNTPGIGWAGGLALICLLIFLFGHQVAGLAGMEDLLLIIVGFLLVLVELFITPGFGFMGLAGLVMMVAGLISSMVERFPGNTGDLPGFGSFANLGPAMNNLGIATLSSLVLSFAMFKALQRSRFINEHLVLQAATSRDQGFAPSSQASTLVGGTGVTVSALRPSGTARVDGRVLDVVSDGEFLEPGVPIRVLNVHGNRILVARDTQAPEPTV